MNTFIQLMISGIAIGLIYALAALGVVIVYKATKILNLAPGGLLLIAAYLAWTLLSKLPVVPAIALTIIAVALVGWLLNRVILQPLIGQPILAPILCGTMIWFFLRGVTFFFWGGNPKMFPTWLAGRPTVFVGEIGIPEIMIWCIVISSLTIIALMLYFKFTRSGLAMRVTAEDVIVSENLGIRVLRVFSNTWVICLLLFLITAYFVGAMQGISQDLDFVGVYGIIVALLGGLESFPGAIIAGLVIGIVQALVGGYATDVMGGGIAETAPFIVMFLISFWRPYGFFGLERIERI
ncbi:MAG: branched-chain amino acid ABC transporter permease [Desulfobacteria bacterium]